MIAASELRIGNSVLDPIGLPKEVSLEVLKNISKGLVYEPIPLSPEILEKCGFKKQLIKGKTDKYWFEKGEISYNEIHEKFWYHGVLENSPKYLHQLQNLYFSLTGGELTFKP